MDGQQSFETLAVAGTTIGLRRQGRGAPLLFLNGGDAFDQSEDFLSALSADREIFVPRAPGYAGVPFADHVRTVHDLALLYLELLDTLELDEVVLVGASFGGWVAAEMAVRSCARLSHLVLIDALGVRFGGPAEREIADTNTTHPELLRRLKYWQPDAWASYQNASEQQLLALVQDRTAEAYYGWKPYMYDPTLKHWLRRIRRPALVLWGAHDGIASVDYGRKLAAALNDAPLHVIERAGHYPHVENPTEVAERIRRFVGMRADERLAV